MSSNNIEKGVAISAMLGTAYLLGMLKEMGVPTEQLLGPGLFIELVLASWLRMASRYRGE